MSHISVGLIYLLESVLHCHFDNQLFYIHWQLPMLSNLKAAWLTSQHAIFVMNNLLSSLQHLFLQKMLWVSLYLWFFISSSNSLYCNHILTRHSNQYIQVRYFSYVEKEGILTLSFLPNKTNLHQSVSLLQPLNWFLKSFYQFTMPPVERHRFLGTIEINFSCMKAHI